MDGWMDGFVSTMDSCKYIVDLSNSSVLPFITLNASHFI